jgi:GH25 family lysozyme M1 (1,4-beta-N-acetylmuramidase)
MKGIDVSSNNHPGNHEIDWFKVADAGYSFAIVKATQGTGYVNPWAVRDLEDARAAGLFVGAYHYYELGQDATAQADNFISALIGQVLDLGAWLDWETAEISDWELPGTYKAFLDRAMEARNPVGTYCDQSWHATLKRVLAPVYRLWVATWGEEHYPGAYMLQSSGSASVAGVPSEVDTDVLLSTRGLNLPSSPPVRPTAATARSMVPAVDPTADEQADERADQPGDPAANPVHGPSEEQAQA